MWICIVLLFVCLTASPSAFSGVAAAAYNANTNTLAAAEESVLKFIPKKARHRSALLDHLAFVLSPQSDRGGGDAAVPLAAKIEDPEDFCFLSTGCWGGFNVQTQSLVAGLMGKIAKENGKVKFVIGAGDNFYKKGVQSVLDERFYETFEKVYGFHSGRGNSPQEQNRALLKGHADSAIPWFMILGNHDYRGDYEAQVEYTTLKLRAVAALGSDGAALAAAGRGGLAASDLQGEKENAAETLAEALMMSEEGNATSHVPLSSEEYQRRKQRLQLTLGRHTGRWFLPHPYYAHAIGGNMLLLIMLDCVLLERCHVNPKGSPRCYDNGEQLIWLSQLLQQHAANFKFRVLTCHYPMFANGPHLNHPWLVAQLQPLMQEHKIQLYINADNHYLQVSKLNESYYLNQGGGGGYMPHTRKDKGYAKSPFDVFEVMSYGTALHCVSRSGKGGSLELKTTIYTVGSVATNVKQVYSFSSPATETSALSAFLKNPVAGRHREQQQPPEQAVEPPPSNAADGVENPSVLPVVPLSEGPSSPNTLPRANPISDSVLDSHLILVAVVILVLAIILLQRSGVLFTGRRNGFGGGSLFRRRNHHSFPSNSVVLGT
jgi:hypothetical protein